MSPWPLAPAKTPRIDMMSINDALGSPTVRELVFGFLSNQLDFILFFYGLGFILLGCVCFAIARGGRQATPWAVLASFAFLHGVSEWLDLIALIVGDTP